MVYVEKFIDFVIGQLAGFAKLTGKSVLQSCILINVDRYTMLTARI